jgi:hypothetical protein
MKVSGALKRLMKKIKLGLTVTKDTNPVNYHLATEKIEKKQTFKRPENGEEFFLHCENPGMNAIVQLNLNDTKTEGETNG